jgi:hypothetical protein
VPVTADAVKVVPAIDPVNDVVVVVIAVPLINGYNVPRGATTLPANVAICEVDNVSAVVPAPEPVLNSNAPVLSAENANPFVALPAEMVVAMFYP